MSFLQLVTVVVEDYDEAIGFFVDKLGFGLDEDAPSVTDDGRPKRWVVVRPPGARTGLLLAQADGARQQRAVGEQVAGRVGFFLEVDDVDTEYQRMRAVGVRFIAEPRTAPYGRYAVFLDIAGNRWDLIAPLDRRGPNRDDDGGRGRGAPRLLPTEDAEQEQRLVDLVHAVLAHDVVGVQRHGSAASEGLLRFSDLDLLVVTGRGVTPAQRRALVHGLLVISGSEPGARPRPVELTVVVEGDVRPWRYPPRVELQYGEWMRGDMAADPAVTGPRSDPDLAVLLTSARQHGVALVGPPATTLLEPVPLEDLRRAIMDGLPGLLAERYTDTRNVVLTLARMLITTETGRIVSKLAAADQVLPRLPDGERDVLALARGVHAGERPELPSDLPRLDDFTERMHTLIRTAP